MNAISKFLILIILVFMPALTYGGTITCADLEIAVETDEKRDADSICRTVKNGRDILFALGLKLPKSLTISFSHKPVINDLCQSKCVGFYDARANKIFLPDYKSATYSSQHSSLFINEEVTPIIWDSYFVHELTHAAVQYTIVKGTPMCIASEYIAAVAQLEAMPTLERVKILDHYSDLHGFAGTDDITLIYYLMDSAKFIVNSYLHYKRPENGPQFIKQILRDGLSCDLL